MRTALAVLVAFYTLFTLGNYHEAAVVSPMQGLMGLSIIPMFILSAWLLVSGFNGLLSKEDIGKNIVIAVLDSTLLIAIGYKAIRRSNHSHNEAIIYNP